MSDYLDDTVVSGNEHSCDTQTSDVQAIKDNPTKSIFDYDDKITNDCSSKRLQNNNATGVDESNLKSHSTRDVLLSVNYIGRSENIGNKLNASSNTNRIREDLWKTRQRILIQRNNTRRGIRTKVIVSFTIAFLFIMTVYLVIYIYYPSIPISKKTFNDRLTTIEPLPQEVYSKLNMNFA